MIDDIPRGLQAPVRALLVFQKWLLVTSSTILAVVFFLVVVLRYGFETDLFAYEEWVLAIAFWLYFIGGAQGSWEDSHIKADFLSAMIRRPRLRWRFALLTNALELGTLIVLTCWGALMVWEDVARYPNWQATVAWNIPLAVPRFGIFVGLFLMALYSALHLYVRLKRGPTPVVETLR